MKYDTISDSRRIDSMYIFLCQSMENQSSLPPVCMMYMHSNLSNFFFLLYNAVSFFFFSQYFMVNSYGSHDVIQINHASRMGFKQLAMNVKFEERKSSCNFECFVFW